MKDGVGFGIFGQENYCQHFERLNSNFSIMSAELLAIAKGMELAAKQNFKFQLIVTDSQSSCQALKAQNEKHSLHNPIHARTHQPIWERQSR